QTMAKEYLGNLELMVLLSLIRVADNAYGVPISHEIEQRTGRDVALGSVYAALDRLERKGYVTSMLGDPTPERGGRAKRYFQIIAHKWLAIRAIVTGYVIWYVFNATLLKGVVRPRLDLLGIDASVMRVIYFGVMYALWLGNGWIIAKLHRPYSTAMVLAYALW